MSYRRYCFTNFDTENTIEFDEDYMKYLCYGVEICPKTNKEHHQGYISLIHQRNLRWMKENVHSEAHFEQCKGSEKQNITYCSKDKKFFEFGKRNSQGKDSIGVMAKSKTPIEICQEYPDGYMRNYRAIDRVNQMFLRSKKLHTVVLCDNEELIMEKYPNAYWKPIDKWTGYYGDKEVVIEDRWCIKDFLRKRPSMIEVSQIESRYFTSEVIIAYRVPEDVDRDKLTSEVNLVILSDSHTKKL